MYSIGIGQAILTDILEQPTCCVHRRTILHQYTSKHEQDQQKTFSNYVSQMTTVSGCCQCYTREWL